MWRIRLDGEPDVVVRLPRRPGAAAGVERELDVLQRIKNAPVGALVATPTVLHSGRPHERFPHRWSALQWIDGADLWSKRDEMHAETTERALALDLAEMVSAIGKTDSAGLSRRQPGDRGGPLAPMLDQLDGWLDDPEWQADRLINVAAVRRLSGQAREVASDPTGECFLHGDLIPGNLLVEQSRLAAVKSRLVAVIDWGGAGVGDPAQDLAPAWTVLSSNSRALFREAVGADDATWIRARAIELEHAVGGVLYYVPRKHLLGDVMARTLQRILADR